MSYVSKSANAGTHLLSVNSEAPGPTTVTIHSPSKSYGSMHALPTTPTSLKITLNDPDIIPQISVASNASIMSGRALSVVPPVHVPTNFSPSFRSKLVVFVGQCTSFFISSFFLALVVIWASLARLYLEIPRRLKPVKPKSFDWDRAEYSSTESIVKEVQPYAQAVGLEIIDEQVETADGFFLRVHRVVNPRHKQDENGRGGFPVLILHGLFQSSGSFITSEERSLAFWLSEQGGYQVFLGNNRGVFNMGHKHYSRSDPRFWDWTIRELAMYDFPALVDYVRDATGYDKIAFIGHSQGNGLAFISLSEGMCPELGEKLSCFVALAPAVFAGPLTRGFPFTLLNNLEWNAWKRIFGVLDFIPLMQWSYNHIHPAIFATMGYTMFAFLFEWTDVNWLKRRKTKMFRFTPTPVSSASIFWWCGKGGFADRQCTMDVSLTRWFTPQFPPLCIFYGGRDFLVQVDPLIERIEKQEPHVKTIRVEKIDASEHCDFYWAADAVEWCFGSILDDIEKTRPREETVVLPN